MQEKVGSLTKVLEHVEFTCSNRWLDQFKTRHDIVFRAIAGEGAAVTEEMTSDWIKKGPPDVLAMFEPRDIFNADETGFFTGCSLTSHSLPRERPVTGGSVAKSG